MPPALQWPEYAEAIIPMNADGMEYTFSGTNEAGDLMIGFEDLVGGGDQDFKDVVVKVEFEPNMEGVEAEEAAAGPEAGGMNGGDADMAAQEFGFSEAVIHGDTVYLAGQVAAKAPGATIAEQTKDTLDRIDELLAEAGTDKSKLLSATIWLADIGTFNEMNEVWDAWVSEGNAPARACVEAKLASPQFTVEIGVIAALS